MKYKDIEIRILPINPRYTNMEEIKFKEMLFPEYSEEEVARELLKFEGDLSDLMELIIAIKDNGFLYLNDQILINLDKDKKYYYVLEGNRRILSIKLINGELLNSDIFGDKPFFKNVDFSSWKRNKENIIKIIKSINKLNVDENWFSDVTLIEDETIWKSIYSKHIGEQIGKRDWSRAKYFDDLLKMYKKNNDGIKNKEIIFNELSILFGKKKNIIKQDIKNAIWIIKSLEIYNENNIDNEIDYRQMEVSGYELLLSQKLIINGKEKSIRDFLGIKVDLENLKFSYSEDISKDKFKEIIIFLVDNSLKKNITTRGIKDEIFNKLSDVIGYSLSNIRTLNYTYRNLIEKNEKNNLSKLEEKQLVLLNNISFNNVNINEFKYNEYDSKFIKSIKYLIRNDLKTLSNLKNFDENEYPFTNIALSIRTIIDLFILEFFYRIKDCLEDFKKEFDISIEDGNKISDFINNYDDSKSHEVNNITSVLTGIVNSKGTSNFVSYIIKIISDNYGKRLAKLGIDINSTSSCSILTTLIDYKKIIDDPFNNFKLLNSLVHKPYCGYEEKDNINMIDNLNKMYNAVKEAMKIFKIWA